MTVPNYDPNELRKDGDSYTPGLRVIPETIQAKTLAAGTGTLDLLTPLAFHTGLGQWVPWDSDGSSGETTIKGFLWPDKAVLVVDKPIIANVLLEGEIHHDDIPVLAGETQSGLDAALVSGLRSIGLIIQGLPKFR